MEVKDTAKVEARATGGDGGDPPADLARRVKVDRLWRRTKQAAFNRSWRNWSLRDGLFLPQLACVSWALVLELRLWGFTLDGWYGELGQRIPFDGLVALLAGIGLINAALAQWVLRRGVSAGARAQLLPTILAVLPGFGSQWAVVVGRRAVERDQARRGGGAELAIDSGAGILSALRNGPPGAALLLPWFTGASFVGCFLGLFVLASTPRREPLWVGLLAAVSVHLLGFALLRLALSEPGGQVSERLSRRLSLAWFLPMPGPQIGWFVAQVLELQRSRLASLSHLAFIKAPSLAGTPLWTALNDVLHPAVQATGPPWRWRRLRRPPGQEPSLETLRFLGVARRKLGLLWLDGVGGGWVLGALVRRGVVGADELVPRFLGLAKTFALISLVVLGAATLLSCTSPVLRRCRGPNHGPSPWVWAMFALLNASAGLLVGLLLGAGDARNVTLSWSHWVSFGLLLTAFLFVLQTGLRRTLGQREGEAKHWAKFFLLQLPWFFAFLWLTKTGRAMPELSLLPPVSLAIGLWFAHKGSPALLAPFVAEDVAARSLPLKVRLALAFLRASLFMPLGGLFTPLWPALRTWLHCSAGEERRRDMAATGVGED